MKSVLQDWVMELPPRHQGTLVLAFVMLRPRGAVYRKWYWRVAPTIWIITIAVMIALSLYFR